MPFIGQRITKTIPFPKTLILVSFEKMNSLPCTTPFSPLDPDNFGEESKRVVDFIVEYYRNVENYPVQSQVEPDHLSTLIPDNAPYYQESLEDILKDITEKIMPGITHWQSPNFFAYFQTNASTAGFLGEMLCSALNIVNFNWISSPAATELESIVIDWMGKLLKLPPSFLFVGGGGGVLHTTTCESIICTLVAARDNAIKTLGGKYENITKFVVYASDQTHFTLQKGAKLVGIPPSNFRPIPTSFSTDFSLSPDKVRASIEEDIKSGLTPLYICATVGTTATGAVDPIEKLGEIAREFNLWFHIDSAYAGSACICPEFRHHLNGVELADSVSFNPHKWFLTNLDCCCLWLKQPKLLTNSLTTHQEIMGYNNAYDNVIDYKDWQITLTRRFRALKLWIVIRKYGLANLMHHIRTDVEMAKKFEAYLAKDDRFEIIAPRKFALVCFRLKAKDEVEGEKLNKKLLNAINSTGRAFMSHSKVNDVYFIRCAIGSTLTEQRHVDDLWKLIQEKARILLSIKADNGIWGSY